MTDASLSDKVIETDQLHVLQSFLSNVWVERVVGRGHRNQRIRTVKRGHMQWRCALPVVETEIVKPDPVATR